MKTTAAAFMNEHNGLAGAVFALCRRAIGSDFVRKVAETLSTQILLIGIGLITGIIVARILGPEGRGIYAMAAAVGAIGVQFANLGLHASNTFYVARDRELLPLLIGNSLVVSFLFGGISAALAWVVFSFWPGLSPINGILLILALMWVPFGLAYMLLQNLLLGIQEVHAYNKINLFNSILTVVIIGLLILLKGVTVESVYCAGLITLIAGFFWVLQRLRIFLQRPVGVSFDLFKDSFQYGVKAYFSAFFALMIQRIDLFMINHYLGTKYTGLYSIAISIVDMLLLFPVVVGTVAFPRLCAMKEWDQRLEFTKKIVITVVGISIPLILSLLFTAEFIITTLYGSRFVPSAGPLVWFMPGFLVWSIEVMYRKLLISVYYPAAISWGWFGSCCLNIGLNAVLIPRFGMNGAAAASSITYFAVASITIILLSQLSRNTQKGGSI